MGAINKSVVTLSDADLGRVSEPTDVHKDNLHAKGIGGKADLSKADKHSKFSNSSTVMNEDESSMDSMVTNALKKPNEILACPRCKSLNTKFCYFNNQNVKQPRHFCKNCQRYWTSGGSMRNVPVGSGKRKSKHSINPSFDQITKKPFNPILAAPPSPTCESADTCTNASKAEPPDPQQICFAPQGYMCPPWAYPWAPAMMMVPPPPPPTSSLPFQFFPMFPVFPDMMSSGGKEEKRTIWVPKTLRVDNPEEAAKSSIWSTLGIKRDESVKRDWLFRGFESPNQSAGSNAAKMSHLNPAALARSRLFQESV